MARRRSGPFLIVGVRLRLVGVVELVASRKRGSFGTVVVHFTLPVSFQSDALARENVLGAVAADEAVGQREEGKIRLDVSGDGHGYLRPARIGSHLLAYQPVARIRRQRVRLVRDTLDFVQFLVVAKDERLVFDDRSAGRAAELVALELGLPDVEVIPGVEHAVAQELLHAALALV